MSTTIINAPTPVANQNLVNAKPINPADMEAAVATLPAGIRKILTFKGQFCSIQMIRPMKVRKGKAEIMKHSRFVVRAGISYDNQAAVQEKRETGELPAENAGLIGREWVIPNYVLRSIKSGKLLIRVTPVHNEDSKRTVEYIRNGQPISKEEAEIDCLASEFADRGDWKGAMDITADYIMEVNGEKV
jgi:hypothetical protein